MSYLFPHVPRKVYNKTFLKDVQVSVYFDDIEIDSNLLFSLRSFIQEKFKTDFNENSFIEGKVGVKSDDELIFFHFAKNFARLKMCFPAYNSFELASKLIPIIQEYFKVLGVSSISKVNIAKFNQLKFEMQSDEMDISYAMKELFSSELLTYGHDEKSSFETNSQFFTELSRWEKQISIDDSNDSGTGIAIEYGFCEHSNDNKTGVLTLKNTVFTTQRIESAVLLDKCTELNNILDDCFVWCVNNKIINSISNK